MRKNFGAKPWLYPQPVLIIATYGEEGTPDAMNGIVSGNTTPDKMARAGFHVTKSEVVDAPVIDELPMTLECKLISFDEESELLLGEIVNVSADERILDSEGKIDPQKLRPITFDPVHNDYLVLGEKVGNAFEDGKKLK